MGNPDRVSVTNTHPDLEMNEKLSAEAQAAATSPKVLVRSHTPDPDPSMASGLPLSSSGSSSSSSSSSETGLDKHESAKDHDSIHSHDHVRDGEQAPGKEQAPAKDENHHHHEHHQDRQQSPPPPVSLPTEGAEVLHASYKAQPAPTETTPEGKRVSRDRHRDKYKALVWSTVPFTSEPLALALPLQVLNVLSFVAVVVINILAWSGAFNGERFDVLHLRWPTFLTPANYSFGIWILIYFFLGLFCLYQGIPAQRHNPVLFSNRGVYFWFFLSNVFNIVWTILFTIDQVWAAWAMLLCLFLCLFAIYVMTGIGRRLGQEVSMQEYLCLHIPFSTYFAWVSFLLCMNLAVALRWRSDWTGNPWTAAGWAVLVLCLLFSVTLILLLTRTDWTFAAIMAWGFLAITHLFRDSQEAAAATTPAQFDYYYSKSSRPVFLTSVILGSLLALFALLGLLAKFYLWHRERKAFLETAPKVQVSGA